MTYLLDTNACISVLRDRNSSVARKLSTLQPHDIAVCSVVKGELFFGAYRSSRPEQSLVKVHAFLARLQSFAFDDIAANIYGQLRAELTNLGNLIGPNDLLIAAIALTHNAVVVTHNSREFSHVPGLRIVDWEEA